MLARGNQSTGRVKVESVQADSSNEIAVDITAQYHDWDFAMGTAVCLMEKEKGELGVGIFVSGDLLIVVVVCSPPTKRHQNT